MKRRISGKMKAFLAMLLAAFFVLGSTPVQSDAYWWYEPVKSTGIDVFDKFIKHKDYKDGAPWGNEHPKLSRSGASGCAAYCADFTKFCYGIDGITSRDSYRDPSQIRAGDIVHLQGQYYGHWIVILGRKGNQLLTADGNWGDHTRVGWNFEIHGNDVLGSQHHFDVGYHFLPATGKWVKESGGWRYCYTAGIYARNAWVQKGKNLCYVGNKYMVTGGWKKIDGKRYYFKKNGVAVTDGWKTIKGKRYYFNKKGVAATGGWKKIDGQKYYFTKTGAAVTGWKTISGKKYYFTKKGVMITGWKKISGKKYYFNAKGAMTTGWKTIEGKKYYFTEKGALYTKSTLVIDDTTYKFNKDGSYIEKKSCKHNWVWATHLEQVWVEPQTPDPEASTEETETTEETTEDTTEDTTEGTQDTTEETSEDQGHYEEVEVRDYRYCTICGQKKK